MDRVLVYSIHSPRYYHRDGAFTSSTVLLWPLLAVCPAAELFFGGVIGIRIVVVLTALFPITLFLHLVLQYIFNLLLQSRHRSLPFGFLVVLIFTPCPELFLLLLAEETINVRGIPFILKLEVLWELPPLDFNIYCCRSSIRRCSAPYSCRGLPDSLDCCG
jgi:hypothetical protein